MPVLDIRVAWGMVGSGGDDGAGEAEGMEWGSGKCWELQEGVRRGLLAQVKVAAARGSLPQGRRSFVVQRGARR